MTKHLVVAALAVAAAALSAPSFHRTVSAQAPAPDRMAIVVSDEPQHLQVWRPAATGYEKVWEATPRVDATWDERRPEQIASAYDGGMKIGDIDGDGSNELVVADTYGITVYGRSPAYYSFPTVEGDAPRLVIADVDDDGAAEIVTQRFSRAHAAEGGPPCEIEVLKVGAGGLASVWKGGVPGEPAGIFAGDVDNDGEKEIISGGSLTVTILKRRPGPKWEAVAELPMPPSTSGGWLAGDSWVQVADVDGDGKNEIIVGGGNGKVTVFRSWKPGPQRVTYPVLWQSANLMADGMTAKPGEPRSPSCLVGSVAVADIDGDKRPEIVAGSHDYGRLGEADINAGRLHVFRFNGRGDFTRAWVSDWLPRGSGVSGIADVDGDGANEIVVAGRNVYKLDSGTNTFRSVASLLPTASSAVVGALPDLREPSGVRIVPLYWTVPEGQVAEGETLDVAVTLRSVWSEAKDVMLTVTAEDPAVEVTNASFKVPSIPANGIVTTPMFKLTGRQSGRSVRMRLDLTAANGYRQAVTTRGVMVLSGTPTYLGDVESRLAGALARGRDDNKRVLIQWGSNADPAATALISIMRKDSEVANTLLYEYEIVRADTKGAERVAAKYRGSGGKAAVPSFTVLDAQGRVLATQAASAFKKPGDASAAYDTRKLNTFLTKFKPTHLKAEPLLAEALSQAKKDQKTLFVYFSAPS